MKIMPFCIALLIIVLIFKNWFIAPFITASDFPYFFRETIAQWEIIPPVWDSTQHNGFGGEQVLYALNVYVYFLVGFFVNMVGLPWEIVYKIFIFGLFILLSVYSSIYFVKKVFDTPGILQIIIAPLLFVSNTYILMVVDGGQMGVALAYSIAPLVLARFIMMIQDSDFAAKQTIVNIKYILVASFALAVQIMFDARLALLVLAVAVAYLLFYVLINQLRKRLIIRKLVDFFSAIFLAPLFHLVWILPTILSGSPVVDNLAKNSEEGLRSSFEFFSFAQFSQTFSFLHPNWPENIFGKVYFMKPEFLLLPILAFSSLLFIKNNNHKKNNQIIIFFALLGIISAFLAKGANPPFEEINIWIFMHMPATEIFRDSTKFYLFIALSYSMLIPFGLGNLYNLFKVKFKDGNNKLHIFNFIPNIFLLSVCLLLLVLIHPVFVGGLDGTFRQQAMPNEYLRLKDFLVNQPNFSRTLWIPRQHHFNFYSYEHPTVSAEVLFYATNSAEILKQFRNEKTKDQLVNLAIQHIIVPYDSFGTIFVKDRKYNKREYEDTLKGLKEISWLEKIEGFEKIGVYKIAQKSGDHFMLNGKGSISYEMKKPYMYEISVVASEASKLIFVENYSPYWIAHLDGKGIESERTKDNLNSFSIDKHGNYDGKIYFSKEKIYSYGKIASLVILSVCIVGLFIAKRYEKRAL